jgi:hypothetical protein
MSLLWANALPRGIRRSGLDFGCAPCVHDALFALTVIRMIIRDLGTSLLLVTQPDHAALAGRIMEHWTADGLPGSPRRADILLAVAEHDNGWREVDAAPVVEPATGALLDFVRAPDALRQDVWPRAIGRLAHAPYAAALVAQHAAHVYARHRADQSWGAFFAEMDAWRDHHLAAAAVPLADLKADYELVRVADLISLTFCAAWRDEQPDGFGRSVRLAGESTVTVSPDPFDQRELPIEIAAIEIPAQRYATPFEARDAMRSGTRRTLRGSVRGGA